MKRYVCGFLFSPGEQYVLLIQKNKPDWQKGFLNGIGGKIEQWESPSQAMKREFHEEVNFFIAGWKYFFTVSNFEKGYQVYFFHLTCSKEDMEWLKINNTISIDEGTISWHLVKDIANLKTIPNLKWLIPMCFDENHDSGLSISKI